MTTVPCDHAFRAPGTGTFVTQPVVLRSAPLGYNAVDGLNPLYRPLCLSESGNFCEEVYEKGRLLRSVDFSVTSARPSSTGVVQTTRSRQPGEAHLPVDDRNLRSSTTYLLLIKKRANVCLVPLGDTRGTAMTLCRVRH